MLTTDWMITYDDAICAAFKAGRVTGEVTGAPTEMGESGLAHIFFYDDTVYKLYKTHADKDHFIKSVLAPTQKRKHFVEHDFALNQHFSGEIYRTLHSVYFDQDAAIVVPYDGNSMYVLSEMSRLDFDTNLHERLLRGDIDEAELDLLGYETARAVDTYPVDVPDTTNWYDLAKERVGFLSQFVDWLPEEFGQPLREAEVIPALYSHLEKHKDEYQAVKGEALRVNIDNHDENVFFVAGQPQVIDVLPPMSCWWYGLPHANLSNLMANIEVLHSPEAAQKVKEGYCRYFEIDTPPAHSFGFTHAFAYLISIAHFGSVPEKGDVTRKYIEKVPEIRGWLM